MTVTDFHSHILPGVDDGSQSVEESIAMLKLEAEQGITHVIATPHFYPQYDSPEQFLERRSQAEQKLREEMAHHKGLPQISIGAEVYFFHGMSESEALPRLTICGKKCMMIEMPPAPWTEDMYRELEAIYTQRGIVPIIAHIERYIRPWHSRSMLRRLSELPVLVQANAGFFLEKGYKSVAMRMLRADQIHLLGSDCHNTTIRKPNLGLAVEQISSKLGEAVLTRISRYERELLDI